MDPFAVPRAVRAGDAEEQRRAQPTAQVGEHRWHGSTLRRGEAALFGSVRGSRTCLGRPSPRPSAPWWWPPDWRSCRRARRPRPGQRLAATAPSAFRAAPVDWQRCKDRDLKKAKARCGYLVVPLDYANPTGPTIQLAVSRILHTKGPYRGAAFANPGGPGAQRAAVLAARRRHPARRRQDLRLVRHGPARRRGVDPGAELRPEVRQLPAPAVPAHDHGDPELLAGQDRGVRRRVRHLGGEGPAAAPEDDGQRGGLRVAPHRDRAGAGDLLRLLLRHLPRAGVGHPAPGLAQGDGARRRREPRPRLVPGEPRPGPRLRDRLQEVLHVDRQARPHLPPGPHRPAGRQAVREAAQAAGEEAGPGQARRR